ncbi:hypothetical protein [Companilactobacillus sp. HBUAS59544]
MSNPQLLAWAIFIVECFITLFSFVNNWINPIDQSSIPNTVFKMVIWILTVAVTVIFQIVLGFVIYKMDSDNQNWLIVLAVLSLIHDPLYLIAVIWKFVVTKKTQKVPNN